MIKTHFDLPATIYAWKNYYETSGHWNVDPPKTVRAVVFFRADDLVTIASHDLLAALKECHNQLATNDLNAGRVYQHLTNERRNMLSAAKLMAKKAIDKAEGQ